MAHRGPLNKFPKINPIWLSRFYGRHPLFAAALVAVSCVAATDWNPWCGLSAGLLLGLAGTFLASWRSGVAWLVCGWISVAGTTWRAHSQSTAERDLCAAAGGQVRALLLKDAEGGGRYWSAPAVILEGAKVGAKIWFEGAGESPVAGAVVKAKGNFEPLPEPRNIGEFDRAAWLRRQGVAAMFRAERQAGKVETGRWALLGAAIRHGFRTRVTAGLADDSQEAIVIRAIVIGETPADADALIAAFRNSGTLHAFSVSGLHVAMVGSIGWLLLSWLGVPRRWAVVLLLPLMFGYSWITGNSAPAVRSAWMAAVFLGAFVFRRQPDLLNALGAVLLAAMLWNGPLLFQPGVQLSYGVVAAIAVGTAWAAKAFAWMAKPELYLPTTLMTRWQKFWLGLRRKVAQSLGVSLAAGVGSAPLTILHFGLVTPISVLAGLVLVPLVFVLLVAALLAVAVYPASPSLARWVNGLNGYVANACVKTAEGFSAVPGGHFQVNRVTQPRLQIFDLTHGAGAACFSAGSHGAVLMDCGDARGFKRVVMPCLRKLGIEPDSIVLSHPDGGHIGGGEQVWQAFPIHQVLLPVERSRSQSFQAWIEQAPLTGAAVSYAAVPQALAFPDGASLEILYAPAPSATTMLADDRVIVSRLLWHGWKILFTNDAGISTETKLLDSGVDPSADVIIAGRHRSDLMLCDRFLNAVHPMAIIASNSSFPISEKLNSSTVEYWKSRGIQVVDHAEFGGVTLHQDDAGRLHIDGFLDKSPLILNPR
ncbi:MAG: ComEC/Rec2 family competence protein [Gloeobacteraceae cyanobacterium ES-bin-144]|nr:ComEC/Rec2 family competence protein [Verrucomicrobiales bacterium]